MKAKKTKTPKTVKELKAKHPKLYEVYLRTKLKSGATFQDFKKEFFK